MSNQILNTNRFHAKRKDAVKANHVDSKPVIEHAPIVSERRELQISGAGFGSTINVEPSLVDALENAFLKVTIAAQAGSDKNVNHGLNCIESIQVKSGSELLMNYPSYKHWARWTLQNCDSVRRAQIQALCFGDNKAAAESVLYLPLPYPGSPYTKGYDCSKGVPLKLGACNSKRPITWTIQFNSALLATAHASSAISDCVLEYDELIGGATTLGQFRNAWVVAERDIKQFPAEALAANTSKKIDGLEANQGAVQSYFMSTITNANNVSSANLAAVEPLVSMEMNVDGTVFKTGDSTEQRQRLNSIMRGGEDATQCNRIDFSRKPFYADNYYENMLHTDGVKRLSVTLQADAASECMPCAVVHRSFSTTGKNIRVRDN